MHVYNNVYLHTQIAGVEKAKAYMESVPYFLKHGDAIEHERTPQQNQQWVESGSEAVKRKSFKMYSDTLSVVRYVCAHVCVCVFGVAKSNHHYCD